jgi:hypothetical protein
MSKHIYRIYYRQNNNRLWKIIYEDDFSLDNYNQLRDRVIKSLEKLNFQYKIVDKFVGVKKQILTIYDQNDESIFDNISNGDFSEKNVNIAINFLYGLQHFISGRNVHRLEGLFFKKENLDLILLIRNYEKFMSKILFTQRELSFFRDVVSMDFRLILAYLFFEFIILRINSNKFSRYAPTEVSFFFDKYLMNLNHEQKQFVFSGLSNLSVSFFESNEISLEAKLNLLSYSNLSVCLDFISEMKIFDLSSFSNSTFMEDFLTKNEKSQRNLYFISFAIDQLYLFNVLKNKNILCIRFQDLNKQLDSNYDRSVFKALLDFHDLEILKNKKRKTKKVVTIAASIIISSMLIILISSIVNSFYRNLIVDASNYSAFISYNPLVTETKYFAQGSSTPSKYFYELDLNEEYLTQFKIKPELTISYSSQIGETSRKLTNFSFETANKLNDIRINVSQSYSEKIRLLKSEYEKLNYNNNNSAEYLLNISPNSFSFEEAVVSKSNFGYYFSINILAPVDTFRNGVYQQTRYEISINKNNNAEAILQASISIKYTMSNDFYMTNSSINTLNFSLTSQSKTDSFGSYRYYDSELMSVTAKIVIRTFQR